MTPRTSRALALSILLAALAVAAAPGPARAANSGFVTVSDARFVLHGRPFHFVGTNAYFLIPSAAWGNQVYTNETLALAQALGFTVLRTWGFFDDPAQASALQPGPGVYNESAFRAMDWVLHRADQAGVRLMISLVNRWPEFGGMQQYVRWCQPGAGFEAFYTNGYCRQLYKNYVSHVINRVNTYNGRRYRDDPTIFAWELGNEIGTTDHWDHSGQTVRSWVAEMAAHVKALDWNHLVTTGEEGYDTTTAGYNMGSYNNQAWLFNGHKGVSFTANTADRNVDFASIHLYAEVWNLSPAGGAAWIADHARIARSMGKPLVLGEFGHRSNMAGVYDQWLRAADAERVGGSLVWQLLCQSCGGMGDHYSVLYPPAGSVSEVLRQAAGVANSRTEAGSPAPAPSPGVNGFAVGSTSAGPAVVGRHQGVTITTAVTSGSGGTALIDLEVYDAAGAKVAQQVYAGQGFGAGQTRSFSWTWPGTGTVGSYTVKVGVFRSDWGALYDWENQAATFEVRDAPTPGPSGGGFTLVGTGVSPGSVARGQTVALSATVRASGGGTAQVDLEVYDAGGSRVGQAICTQSFGAGETRTCTWSWPVPGWLAPGSYTLKVGIFSGNWSTLHLWVNSAGTLAVH
jgi:mannan endo-1,4-beta-mannosidase